MTSNIRFLSNKDLKKFQNFVSTNWNKKHIFTKNKRVISFFYNNKNKKKLNILGMFQKNILVGVLGLITYRNWDIKLNNDIFMAFMVKSNKFKEDITFRFFNTINKKIKPDLLAVSGFNSKIELIYKRLGHVCSFSHFYILNPKLKPKISSKLLSKKNQLDKKTNLTLKVSKKITYLPPNQYYPKKSLSYFKNKYLQNPFYKYFVINFYEKKKIVFFFICKKVYVKNLNRGIYRIIDLCGKIKKDYNLYNLLSNLIIKDGVEYIDCRCVEYNNKIIHNLGFNKKKRNQLIPEYFEPFVKKNIDLKLCIFKNKYKNLLIFKGDGDQDRPSII